MSSSLTATERPRLRDGMDAKIALGLIPGTVLKRLLVRLAFAAPFALLSLLSLTTGRTAGTYVTSPNALLLTRIDSTDLLSGRGLIGQLFPPISSLIAMINPLGMLGLGLLGALCAGMLLQKLMESLLQRSWRPSFVAVFLIALSANPLFAHLVTQDFSMILALTFFVSAFSDLFRFEHWGNTEAGFRAGILLLCAALSNWTGLLYCFLACVAAPFVAPSHHQSWRGRGVNVLVLAFPTLATFATVVVLDALISGAPWQTLDQAGAFSSANTVIFTSLFTTALGLARILPLISISLVAILSNRTQSILLAILVFWAMIAGAVFGVVRGSLTALIFMVLTVLASTLLPNGISARERRALIVVCAAQIPIAWGCAMIVPTIVAWMSSL